MARGAIGVVRGTFGGLVAPVSRCDLSGAGAAIRLLYAQEAHTTGSTTTGAGQGDWMMGGVGGGTWAGQAVCGEWGCGSGGWEEYINSHIIRSPAAGARSGVGEQGGSGEHAGQGDQGTGRWADMDHSIWSLCCAMVVCSAVECC